MSKNMTSISVKQIVTTAIIGIVIIVWLNNRSDDGIILDTMDVIFNA